MFPLISSRSRYVSFVTDPISSQSWSYADAFVAEDDVLTRARERAQEVGVVAIGPGGGAALRFLASVMEARAVVEVGTGTGVSGLWLLRGMRSDGILTTVDIETEHQRLARETFNEAGIPTQRARTIAGAALDVLPRLTDGHYDIAFVDGDKAEYTACLKEALRLLRPGGVLAFDNALWHDRVADPSVRDDDTLAIRELIREVGADDSLVPVLLPVGDGLLLAKKALATLRRVTSRNRRARGSQRAPRLRQKFATASKPPEAVAGPLPRLLAPGRRAPSPRHPRRRPRSSTAR